MVVYFQPKGINPKYCEVGQILDSDPDYVHFIYEPCKVLISDVIIINDSEVYFDHKEREYKLKVFSSFISRNHKEMQGIVEMLTLDKIELK